MRPHDVWFKRREINLNDLIIILLRRLIDFWIGHQQRFIGFR